MKLRAALPLLGLALVVMRADAAMTFAIDGDWAAGSFGPDDWADGSFAEAGVIVPELRGEADFATADGILEGLLLDGFERDPVCSNTAPEFEIVRQSPKAGTEVPVGTVVQLTPSSGEMCPESSGGNNKIGIRIGIGL